MTDVFAPGCALLIDRPELARRVPSLLGPRFADIAIHTTCCRHEPGLPPGTRVVNVCPGCDRRYRELYDGVSTISAWEILAERGDLALPDYGGRRMTIADACPTRTEPRVQEAIRELLARMGIDLVEPARTGPRARCCGDRHYGTLPLEAVVRSMRRRAAEMPADDVVVYCVSCVKSVHIGGRRPRHLVDLLFGEPTDPGTFEPDAWHGQLEAFIEAH